MTISPQHDSLAFAFAECAHADLLVDGLYLRGPKKEDDPTGVLIGGKRSGGFRPKGKGPQYRLMAMYTTLSDPAWPDHLDLETGLFVYHGDVKKPGITLDGLDKEGYVRVGNRHLEYIFVKRNVEDRTVVCPHLVFESVRGDNGKEIAVRFRGLAAPGHPDIPTEGHLVAEWRHLKGVRFQNYRAHFCILNVQRVTRAWLNEIEAGNVLGEHCPSAWRKWVEAGTY